MLKFVAIVTLEFSLEPTIFINMTTSITNSTPLWSEIFISPSLKISLSYSIKFSTFLSSIFISASSRRFPFESIITRGFLHMRFSATNIEFRLKSTLSWLFGLPIQALHKRFNWVHQLFNIHRGNIFSIFKNHNNRVIFL